MGERDSCVGQRQNLHYIYRGKGRGGALAFPLEGRPPCPSPPMYRGVRGGLLHTTQGAAPPLPSTSPPPYVLGEALSEYFCTNYTTPSCYCVTESFPASPSLLAGSRHGRRHRAVRVLNAEVPSVRRWSSVIWITSSTTTSSPFFERFRARSTKVCRCI